MTVEPLFRDTIASRLREDLVGPRSEHEVLTDRPTQFYSTGILYPQDSPIEDEEDQDKGLAVNESEDAASDPDTAGVPLYAALKPSVAGLSFAVKPETSEGTPVMGFRVQCATYESFAVDEGGEEVPGPPPSRSRERWRRHPRDMSVDVDLSPGETRLNLGTRGIDGLELYVLVTPHSGLLTVTAALANLRSRGDSRVFDEAQHFFQVEILASGVAGGEFAPRPSRRAETDEDSRSAALIYRDVAEYVVGHTCSAQAVLNGDGSVVNLKTEWIPSVAVASTSDQGDRVFDALRDSKVSRPLEAAWLAEANHVDLARELGRLIVAYRQWISDEEQRVTRLADTLRPQAWRHLERCKEGADRMEEGVALIRDDGEVRSAFQLSQRAMNLQFGWLRGGSRLVWRPFQLGFQLLVLVSLANRSHPGRAIMDLLWFPTGGGKTEAYLALSAFIILLRRVRATDQDAGAGVAVLMRYTRLGY